MGEHFQPIGPASDVEEGGGKAYQIGGINGPQIAVFRIGGELHCIDEMCTHADASLAFGGIADGCVSCPWHGAEFDLCTGEAKSLPAVEGVNVYPVREHAGQIEVDIDHPK